MFERMRKVRGGSRARRSAISVATAMGSLLAAVGLVGVPISPAQAQTTATTLTVTPLKLVRGTINVFSRSAALAMPVVGSGGPVPTVYGRVLFNASSAAGISYIGALTPGLHWNQELVAVGASPVVELQVDTTLLANGPQTIVAQDSNGSRSLFSVMIKNPLPISGFSTNGMLTTTGVTGVRAANGSRWNASDTLGASSAQPLSSATLEADRYVHGFSPPQPEPCAVAGVTLAVAMTLACGPAKDASGATSPLWEQVRVVATLTTQPVWVRTGSQLGTVTLFIDPLPIKLAADNGIEPVVFTYRQVEPGVGGHVFTTAAAPVNSATSLQGIVMLHAEVDRRVSLYLDQLRVNYSRSGSTFAIMEWMSHRDTVVATGGPNISENLKSADVLLDTRLLSDGAHTLEAALGMAALYFPTLPTVGFQVANTERVELQFSDGLGQLRATGGSSWSTNDSLVLSRTSPQVAGAKVEPLVWGRPGSPLQWDSAANVSPSPAYSLYCQRKLFVLSRGSFPLSSVCDQSSPSVPLVVVGSAEAIAVRLVPLPVSFANGTVGPYTVMTATYLLYDPNRSCINAGC